MKKLLIIWMMLLPIGLMNAQWVQTNGPEGGAVNCFASKGSYLFVGLCSGGLLKSTNNGASWNQIEINFPSPGINTILIVGDTIYITVGGYDPGIYQSTNNGTTWTSIGTEIPYHTSSLVKIGTNLFAGTWIGGIYRTTNNGNNWVQKNTGLTDSVIKAMAVIGSTIFAGMEHDGVFRSTDNGENWCAVNSGLTNTNITSFGVNGLNLFVGTGGGVFLSTNNGNSWSSLAYIPGWPSSFAFSGTDIFVGTNCGGIFFSSNYGASWTNLSNDIFNKCISALFRYGTYLFAGTDGDGIYRSTNFGINWSRSNNGLYHTNVVSLVDYGGYLFSGTWGAGIFRSSNYGTTWYQINSGLTNVRVHKIIVKDTLIFLGTDDGVFRSTNFGDNWVKTNTGITNNSISGLAVIGNYIFAGTGDCVFRSTNDGGTWLRTSNGIPNNTIIWSLKAFGTRLFAGSDVGVYTSTDNGASWVLSNNGISGHVNEFAAIGSTIFAASYCGDVYGSTNYGLNWIPVPSGGACMHSMLVYNNYLFAGSWWGGVHQSNNMGTNWSVIYPHLYGVNSLGVKDGYLFAGPGNDGVIRRPLSEILPYASISGTVFNDLNGNGIRNEEDTGIVGWKVFLRNSSGNIIDSTLTQFAGSYLFELSSGGTYSVIEFQDTGWIQTYPSGLGGYKLNISQYEYLLNKDFGNTIGYRYTGPGVGNWSDSSNWTGGHPPGITNPAIIPPNVTVIVDSLPKDTIFALKIAKHGTLQFAPQVGKLNVINGIQIDPDALIKFPETSDTTGMVCYKDWVNRGTINPGHSIITFAGNTPKSIASDNALNTFYKLRIDGDSTETIGNVTIKDQLILTNTFILREQDSIIIENNDTSAISDTGRITQGTIKRYIKPSETGTYRFESPESYIKFTGEGTNPNTVSITTIPNRTSVNLLWDSLGGRIDTVKNIIVVDTVSGFSKWVFGRPRPRIATEGVTLFETDPINRIYKINAEGGVNYKAQVSLRYEQSEVPESITESELKLLRGPYLADSLMGGWNMISLPLIPKNNLKTELFPTAITNAFAFDEQYVARSSLSFGEGYWLKFPFAQLHIITGEDRESNTVPVNEGWNLIGTISYPIKTSSITSNPGGIIRSEFFSYNGGYIIVDSLKPLSGYWVKVNQNGRLILSKSEENMFTMGKLETGILNQFNTLTFCDAIGKEFTMYFGKDDKIELNKYELPPKPPDGIFDIRYASGRMLEVVGKETKDYPIQISYAEYPITIRWELKEATQYASLIIDGQVINLNKNGYTEIRNQESEIKLRLTSSPSTELPKEFALYQNYPNPFNPITTIKYQIPVVSKVTLKIYNILGQEIKTLVDEIQEAGYKSVEWNASKFPTGVYIYRLTAGAFTDVKKSLLVK